MKDGVLGTAAPLMADLILVLGIAMEARLLFRVASMRARHTGGQALDETREKLIEAAGQVFAERGFQEATVREICSRAGTNLS